MKNFRMRSSFIRLVREIKTFLDKDIGSSISLFDLDYEKLENIENLPLIIELGKDVISNVKAQYGPTWNDFGWNYWNHAQKIGDEIKILQPLADKMISEDALDISEILKQIRPVKVLPDGIDYVKYRDIIEDLKLPNVMFQFIFVCENILRKFIIQVLDENSITSVKSLGISSLIKKINARQKEESKKKYLPLRGSHDVYYLDLVELKNVIINEFSWDFFKKKIISQSWISEKIDSLYSIRNRVAHNSGSLTNDELKSVETYCREIIKQIDSYI